MSELVHFGVIVLVVATGFLLAVTSTRLAERIRVPPGALFLLGAAVTSDLFPSFSHLSIRDVERVASVALAVILFDGGLRVGWRRVRESAIPIVSLGLLGTFATTALLALTARFVLGFSWATSGVLGAALAPTDPAIMFSVLGRREITGRTGTILEGESGANDPVGIALTLAMVAIAGGAGSSWGHAAGEFVTSLVIGVVIGVAAGFLMRIVIVKVPVRDPSLDPLRTLGMVGVVFGAAAAVHGSGFLAAYVAGIVVGDLRFRGKRAMTRFFTTLATLSEVIVFIALGLTVHLADVFRHNVWLDGLILALLTIAVARPLALGPLLVPASLDRGERGFVLYAGLKGAVPILLASFAFLGDVPHAERIYLIVFVVVALSVTLQAAAVPSVARLLGVGMNEREPERWE